MPRFSPNRPARLTAEERRLQKEAEELRRKQQELEKHLRSLPARIEAKKSRERELARLRAETASPAISLSGNRSLRGGRQPARRAHLPARELHNARIKFIVLCLILAMIVILLWRAIP